MTDADYIGGLALLPNASAQTKSLLHSLEQVTESIGFFVNANKTELCSKQKEAISTLNGKVLKLIDQFPYLSSIISSTETDLNVGRAETWNCPVINHIEIWSIG